MCVNVCCVCAELSVQRCMRSHCHTCFFLWFRRFFFDAGLIEQPTYFFISIVLENGGIVSTIFAFFFLSPSFTAKMFPTKIVGSSHRRESYLEHEIRVVHFLCCARPLFVRIIIDEPPPMASRFAQSQRQNFTDRAPFADL